MSAGPVFVALTAVGAETARHAADALGGEVHVLATAMRESFSLGERVDSVTFTDTASHLRSLFDEGRPIVGVCAAGILIRVLAPLLSDKREEPPVVAASEDGGSVVPLLGGHRGANDLARTLAEALGGHAAITTAGDNRFGVALDRPPEGWTLANPQDAKAVMAALLAGAEARLEGDAVWLKESRIPFSDDGTVRLVATTHAVRASASAVPPPLQMGEGDHAQHGGGGGHRTKAGHTPPPPRSAVPLPRSAGEEPAARLSLVYHPRRLAVGLGSERGADPEEAIALLRQTLDEANRAAESIALVASIDVKADEPAILAAAEALSVPARFFTAAALEAETPRLKTPSDAVFREVGCHGVAEGAALAAAGANGRLVVAKRKSARVTCAIAEASEIIDPKTVGRARGKLAVVGIGPGAAEWLTPEARRLLEASDVVVGYSLYLDLVAPLIVHAERFESPLGAEETRVKKALSLAAEGRSVALVSSGDAGIYALATLVLECLDAGDLFSQRAKRIEIIVAPGVSAMQAAAARAGAPLGHDFCAISLSDLLTPWATIEARIRAAAGGDFVIAFYNPVSARRRTQLAAAKAILLKHRPPETPVVLARNLGRDCEEVRTVSLADLQVDDVDMLTLVLVGASTTRGLVAGGRAWTYTPRGYAKKHRPPPCGGGK